MVGEPAGGRAGTSTGGVHLCIPQVKMDVCELEDPLGWRANWRGSWQPPIGGVHPPNIRPTPFTLFCIPQVKMDVCELKDPLAWRTF